MATKIEADTSQVDRSARRSGDADVYRVCAGTLRRWDVYQEPSGAPIASFDDKAAALNYAMCLARGRVAWHLLLRPATDRNGNAGDSRYLARH